MKETRIAIRLSEEEKETLEFTAKKMNQNLSQYLLKVGLESQNFNQICVHIEKLNETQTEISSLITELNTSNKLINKSLLEVKSEQQQFTKQITFFAKYIFSNNFILGKLFTFLIKKHGTDSENLRKYIPAGEHKSFVNEAIDLMQNKEQGLQ